MLSRKQLKEYRELRQLSLREVANHCDISHMMIQYIEQGERDLTERCYKEIIKGINAAYAEKKAGKVAKKPEPKPEVKEVPKAEVPAEKPEVKKATRKTTAKKAAIKK